VADYYKIKVADMYSKRRPNSIAMPRQVAMYLAKEMTQKSLPELGELFGGRDHTTVLHAVRKINQHRAKDSETEPRAARSRAGAEGLSPGGQGNSRPCGQDRCTAVGNHGKMHGCPNGRPSCPASSTASVRRYQGPAHSFRAVASRCRVSAAAAFPQFQPGSIN